MSSNEVTVLNAASWVAQAQQFAQILARASAGQVIPATRGGAPAPDRMATITDPTYWSGDPRILAEALADLAGGGAGPSGEPGRPDLSSGAVAQSPDRLTLTVEEAAATPRDQPGGRVRRRPPRRDPVHPHWTSRPGPAGRSSQDAGSGGSPARRTVILSPHPLPRRQRSEHGLVGVVLGQVGVVLRDHRHRRSGDDRELDRVLPPSQRTPVVAPGRPVLTGRGQCARTKPPCIAPWHPGDELPPAGPVSMTRSLPATRRTNANLDDRTQARSPSPHRAETRAMGHAGESGQ